MHISIYLYIDINDDKITLCTIEKRILHITNGDEVEEKVWGGGMSDGYEWKYTVLVIRVRYRSYAYR